MSALTRYQNRITVDQTPDRYRAAALLCNFLTCMEGRNQITTKFGTEGVIPSLHDYLYPGSDARELYNPSPDDLDDGADGDGHHDDTDSM
jgi:hypothetical protein